VTTQSRTNILTVRKLDSKPSKEVLPRRKVVKMSSGVVAKGQERTIPLNFGLSDNCRKQGPFIPLIPLLHNQAGLTSWIYMLAGRANSMFARRLLDVCLMSAVLYACFIYARCLFDVCWTFARCLLDVCAMV